MATLAVTSFFITKLRPSQFSAIHLLSILVLASLAIGLWLIRHRRIRAHAIHMQALYLQALLGWACSPFSGTYGEPGVV